jgi:hypothetical protein
MLSSVLRSPRAIEVNVEIMRAFVRLRQLLESHAELAKKLNALEKKYDTKFKVVFEAIRESRLPLPRAEGRSGSVVIHDSCGHGSKDAREPRTQEFSSGAILGEPQ